MTQEEYERYAEEMSQLAREAEEASEANNQERASECWVLFAKRAQQAIPPP